MEAEQQELAAALGLPTSCDLELAPQTSVSSSCRLALVRHPGGETQELVLRAFGSDDALQNHVTVLSALNLAGFPHAPRLVTVAGRWACEQRPPGVAAAAIAVEPEQAADVCQALAALHLSGLADGRSWESATADFGAGELPLFRLGFTAAERARALEPTLALQNAIGPEWAGPSHGQAIASNVLLGEGGPWLLDFASAGAGLQLFDVAAFLLSSGLPAERRRAAARSYGGARGVEPDAVADLVDAAGLLWGLDYLISLPRREIELLGDDASREWLRLTATRVSHAIRDPAGANEAAGALRSALWSKRE